MASDRYARQRLIEWLDQERLKSARVLVAGAGALGNVLLENLALMGIGHVLVIDFDRVEESNLSRCALFDSADVGAAKVDAAARGLERLNPEVEVRTIDGDLFYDVGLGWYRRSDLAIGCLDSLAARSQLGLAATLAGIPYLDAGMWALGGEVRCFLPGDGPCFDCTLGPDDASRAFERRSCSGFRDPAEDVTFAEPTLMSTAAIIGGLAAQEAVKGLCGRPWVGGRALVYNGEALRLHRADLPRNPRCPSSHSPYGEVRDVPRRADEITAGELLELARRDLGTAAGSGSLLLELGRDFLEALRCPACGRGESVGRILGQVAETERLCPHCGTVRESDVLRSVEEKGPQVGNPLAHLGIPDGEVLAVRTETGELSMYGLTGGLWP